MCLAPGPDLISDVIRKQGRWRDCGKAVRLWASLDGNTARPSYDHADPSSPSPTGVLLEVGSNIGACTVELLLRTRASIIAVEPSPSNLFYLTRSLRLAAKREPSIADRVVVLPIGAGDVANASIPLFTQANNSGNSVLGRAFTADCSREDPACWRRSMHRGGTVGILPLDEVFPLGLGGVRLLKLDAQGYECKILDGLARARALGPPSIAGLTVVAELASGWLSAQCCGMQWLQTLMRLGPAWRVACTAKAWAEATCVSHAEQGSNTSLLPTSVVGTEEIPPLTNASHVAELKASMGRCRRGEEVVHPQDVLPLERPECPELNPEEAQGTAGRCRMRKAKGLCSSRANWVRIYCPVTCELCQQATAVRVR